MPSTTGMKPGGFYDEHSSGQRSSIEILLPWVEEAARAAKLPDTATPITIVDYGCSEGRNSLLVLGRAAEVLHEREPGRSICPVFSDLASNNFNAVLANLKAGGQLAGDRADFYPLVAGGSFYGPLLPPASVHLGVTFNAVCWLDTLPSEPIPDFIIYPGHSPHRPDVTISPAAVRAFLRQAELDLHTFLSHRARELASGARLLVAMPGRNERYWTGGGIYDLLHDACMAQVREGKLDGQAYRDTVMPVYFRSLEEVLHPVQAADSPLASAFAVEKVECHEVPTPFVVEFRKTDNLDRYAEQYVGFVQAFSEPILRAGLEAASGAARWRRFTSAPRSCSRPIPRATRFTISRSPCCWRDASVLTTLICRVARASCP